MLALDAGGIVRTHRKGHRWFDGHPFNPAALPPELVAAAVRTLAAERKQQERALADRWVQYVYGAPILENAWATGLRMGAA